MGCKMKILLVHRYFWPDTPPYAAMLRSIGKRLAEEGHQVSVLSSQPSYKASVSLEKQASTEQLDGMTVHRIALLPEASRHMLFRLLNMVYFPLSILFFVLFKGRFDVVMVSTAPPVVVGFSTALAVKIRGGSFLYHCMDLHPEIGAISGEFKNPLVFKILRALDTFSCNVAKKVIVLSADMKKSIEQRPGFKKGNIIVLNNFSMPEHDVVMPVDPGLLKKKGKFRLLFAGNLGRFQGLETFIDAIRLLSHVPDIELTFLGEGNALSSLKQQAHDLDSVTFFPHQSVSVAREIMRDADLGIVSLNKDIYKYAFPSKTMTYLAEGCPLLVSVEKESELVSFVDENDIGVCAEIGSPQSISTAVASVFQNKARHDVMKKAAKKLSETLFDEDVVLAQWSSLVRKSVG